MLHRQLHLQPGVGRIADVEGGSTVVARGQGAPQGGRKGLDDVVTVTVTCLNDGRAHVVPDTSIVGGAHNGCYEAVCGHVVTAAPMVEPDGKPCPACDSARPPERVRPGRRLGLRLLGGGWVPGASA